MCAVCESNSQLLAFFPFQVFGKVEIENRGKGDEDFRQRERRGEERERESESRLLFYEKGSEGCRWFICWEGVGFGPEVVDIFRFATQSSAALSRQTYST